MSIGVSIRHGAPIYLSPAVVPSRDTVVPTASGPQVEATIDPSLGTFYIYVEVRNTGTSPADDLGCGCAVATPADWPEPVGLTSGLGSGTGPAEVHPGSTLTPGAARDRLTVTTTTGTLSKDLGDVNPTHRVWGWSPDNRYFAYVYQPTNAPAAGWRLTIISLTSPTLQTVVGYPQTGFQTYSAGWSRTAFRWAGDAGVIYSEDPGLSSRFIACPEAPSPNVYSETVSPAARPWTTFTSPCGSVVAFFQALAGQPVTYMQTSTPGPYGARRDNAPHTVQASGSGTVGIRTISHTARGVELLLGNNTATDRIDDPDCTGVGFGAVAHVDRVLASTLPTANLGVVEIGESAIGALPAGQAKWVQVPNTSSMGWFNYGETHWCLLGQAYTNDQSFSTPAIRRPWDGQAPTPPAFPAALPNCGQHNIAIKS